MAMGWEDVLFNGSSKASDLKVAARANNPARVQDNYPMPYRFGQFPGRVDLEVTGGGWTVYLEYKDKTDEYYFEQKEEADRFYDKRASDADRARRSRGGNRRRIRGGDRRKP